MSTTVLHVLRCVGYAGLPRVADAAGWTEPDTESALIDLAVAGFVTHTAGDFGGWGLTAAGRAEDDRRTAAEVTSAGALPAVTSAYRDFLVLNPELLDLCTAWQTRSLHGVTEENDHTDTAYDARVLAGLGDLHRRAEGVCAALSAALPRFDRYRARLTTALTRARSGETAHLTDDMASYHVVWFQLHEDLLVTLGTPRHS